MYLYVVQHLASSDGRRCVNHRSILEDGRHPPTRIRRLIPDTVHCRPECVVDDAKSRYLVPALPHQSLACMEPLSQKPHEPDTIVSPQALLLKEAPSQTIRLVVRRRYSALRVFSPLFDVVSLHAHESDVTISNWVHRWHELPLGR